MRQLPDRRGHCPADLTGSGGEGRCECRPIAAWGSETSCPAESTGGDIETIGPGSIVPQIVQGYHEDDIRRLQDYRQGARGQQTQGASYEDVTPRGPPISVSQQ